MRELKFRKWNKTAPCYFNLFLPLSVQEGEIIEQYTGLKDKNGKEIYEGDILREKWHDSETHRGQDRIGEVEYFCDGYVCWFRGTVVQLGMFPVKNIEVIGNIHENPEPLRVEAQA